MLDMRAKLCWLHGFGDIGIQGDFNVGEFSVIDNNMDHIIWSNS